MAEVLSQSQIDALMKEMRSGGKTEGKEKNQAEEKKYRKYDFYSPKKITKDKIKLLKGIYDNYSRIASSRLNGILRVSCELGVLAVEEQRFYEFSNALSDNDVFMIQTLKLPNGIKRPPILLHINQAPMVSMIDRMLGGDGIDMDEVDSNYSYTDIEIELYKKVMGYFASFTLDAWAGYIQMESEGTDLEENPSLFQEISLDETVAIILLSIVTGPVEGKVTVCIPRALLSEMFSIIDSRKHTNDLQEADEVDGRNIILTKIKGSALTVKANMGNVGVSVRDVRDLKVGDIIDLGKPKDSEVSLDIGGVSWVKGKLGSYKKNSAVLVSGRSDAETESGEIKPPVPAE